MATSINNYKNIEHLVLSGGGLLGISYIGLLRYLEEENIFCNVKTITGCSAGAMFGSLMAIGYKSNELETIIKNMNFKHYLNINVDSILNFMKSKGLESGNNLINLIKKCIKDKIGNDEITFGQLREQYKIDLRIGVTNLTKYRFEIFSHINYPNLPIHRAIHASFSIPFIFEPVIIDDDIYCDGGVLDNLPINTVVNTTLNDIISNNCNDNDNDNNNADDCDNDADDGDDSDDDGNANKDSDVNEDDKKETKAIKEKIENRYLDIKTLAVYLMNKPESINKNNLHTITLNNYLNTITRTISNNLISKKFNNKNTKKHTKLVVFEIPCDIMTFIKINASKDDVHNIIEIAYNQSKKELKIT
jgi:NTE family protein